MSPMRRPVWSIDRARAAGLLAACVATGLGCRSTGDELPFTQRGAWRTSVVYEGDEAWHAVSTGDIDVNAPGDELIAVGAEGAVVYLVRSGAGVVSEFPSNWGDSARGHLMHVALGDVDRELPGVEAVVVGEQGAGEADGGADTSGEEGRATDGVAWLLARGAEGFTRTELLRTAAPLSTALIADLDPRFAGNEVALAGAGREVVLLVRTAEGLAPRTIASLPGAARAMAATDAGLVVACDDGSLVWLAPSERPAGLADPGAAVEPWNLLHTWRAEGALTSVAARGGLVLVCGEDGVLRLFQTAGAGLDIAFVRETRCLTLDVALGGTAFGDIDAREAGDELLAVADDGTVHVVRLTPWSVADDVVPTSAGFESYRVRTELVAEDSGPLGAIAAGRFSPLGPGAVDTAEASVMGVVCAGASGRILLVTHTASTLEEPEPSALQGP